MDYIKILKRAWRMLWAYRALWIFGIILAMTTVSWESQFMYTLGGNDGADQQDRGTTIQIDPESDVGEQIAKAFEEEFKRGIEDLEKFLDEDLPIFPNGRKIINTLIAVASVIFVLFVIGKIARYVGETALIQMVNKNEESGEKSNIKQGFRLGWSRASWRLFLIDLLFFLLLTSVILLLGGIGALVAVPLLAVGRAAQGIFGGVFAAGMIFLMVFFGFVGGAVLSLLKPFFRRVCVLDAMGVIESIRQGYAIVRKNFKETGIMWLIQVGISLVYPILSIPIVLLLSAAGVLLGGLLSLLTGGLSGWFWGGEPSIVWMISVGVVIFILVLAVPLTFLGGLRAVFQSSSWTLTFRELRTLKFLENGELPELESPEEK